jgi:hypothetical protein
MFTWLDALTLAIILAVVATNVFFILWLAGLPGSVARGRGHPEADAIAVLGWLSLLTLFATWPVAIVWAYSRPAQVRVAPAGGEAT